MGCNCGSSTPNLGNFDYEKEISDNSKKQEENSKIIIGNLKSSKTTISRTNRIKFAVNKSDEKVKKLTETLSKNNYDVLSEISFDYKDRLNEKTLAAYEKFNSDTENFLQKVNADLYDEIKEKKKKLPTLRMPIVKSTVSNSLYDGEYFYDEKNEEYFRSNGKLITGNNELIEIDNQTNNGDVIDNCKIFYPNGDIYIGSASNNKKYTKINGVLFEGGDSEYKTYIRSDNFQDGNKINITKVLDDDHIYEGEAKLKNGKYVFEGKGKLTNNKTQTKYEGNFKNGFYNGKGQLFKCKSPVKIDFNAGAVDENQLIGETIIANWVNGKPNGQGVVKKRTSLDEELKTTKCIFRYGKIIKNKTSLVKRKHVLNENIYKFLKIVDINIFASELKTRSLLKYLKRKNSHNLHKLNLYRSILKIEKNCFYKSELFNEDLFEMKIDNLGDIVKNLESNLVEFLPIVGYKTNGGEVEYNSRCYNIFDPHQDKIYSTHYLLKLNKNILVNGIFNSKLYHNFQDINQNFSFFLDENNLIDQLNIISAKFFSCYEEFEKIYPVVNKCIKDIDFSNYILNEDVIGNISKKLLLFHYISFKIPKRVNNFSVLTNPCYFFAVYLGIYNDEEPYEKNEIGIDRDFINDNNYEMKLLKMKLNKYVIKMSKNENFEYLEFDTSIQKNYKFKLLCLIKVKNLNIAKKNYVINLKKFYHVGNMINIKLINSRDIYNNCDNEEGYSIDFGTINFFGDIIRLSDQ